MGNHYPFLCFYPTCGYQTSRLCNILSHLFESHDIYIEGMDYEFDLCVDFFITNSYLNFLEVGICLT